MAVLIIDYGISNLGSIARAVEECGHEVLVSSEPSDIKAADHVILPGVGAFFEGMNNLKKLGWDKAIRQETSTYNIPLLGICLGMQLLASHGTETMPADGLGLIPGSVEKLNPINNERVPHVGWNEIHRMRDNRLLHNIADGTDFYFVHSYHFIPDNAGHIVSMTPYCGEFVSIVNAGSIYGTQFHPEKSNPVGFQLLRNFLELC